MRTLNTPLSVTSVAIALSLMLSACAGEGTVTTIDANPIVTIGLPQVLLDASFIDSDDISPTIRLSNGASVTMQKGDGDAWSGTINVAPGALYTATVEWAEFYEEQILPLARLERTIEVATDGSFVTLASTEYSTVIDTDGDLTTNLEERRNGTDPFTAPEAANFSEPANDARNNESDTPTTDSPALEPVVVASQTPTTGPAQSPTASPVSAPAATPSVTETPAVTATPSSSPTTTPPLPTATPPSVPAPSATPVNDSESTPDSSPVPDSAPDEESNDVREEEEPETETVVETDSAETTPDPVIAVADVIVPRIARSDAPNIDGNDVTLGSNGKLTGEWAAAVQTNNSGAPLFIDNLIIDISAEKPDGTPFRRWAAMHDGTYLYVVVIVDDNGDRHRDSLAKLTDDDSLELFIDGDNSKSSSYGRDDFHRIFPVKLPGVDKRSATRGDIAGPNSSSAGLVVSFATGPGIGPRGIRRSNWEQDVYELKIDLSSAGIDTDEAFGFELQINDDDLGDERDSKWAWKHPSRTTTDVDSTVDDPSSMGTLKLE